MLDIKDIRRRMGSLWDRMEEYMCSSLASDIDYLSGINASLLSGGGKKLRPLLSLLTAKACGDAGDDSCRYAAATELLHNATLLHDDVADESDVRRGKPTLNALMGPSVSVLVGDYWLVKAVSCILGSRKHDDKVVRLFAKTLSDLAEGEMLQLQKAESGDTSEKDYLKIIYCKTASLFEAASVAAAWSVDAPEYMVEAARDFAVNLGLAFQIKDDIFDYSPEMNVGKPAGADLLERKITLPLLGAFLNCPAEREDGIRRAVKEGKIDSEKMSDICDFVHGSGGVAYAESRMGDFMTAARASLLKLPESEARRDLEDLLDFVGDRNN